MNNLLKSRETVSGPYEPKNKKNLFRLCCYCVHGRLVVYDGTTILPALQGRMAGLNVSQYAGARAHQIAANSRNDLVGSVPLFGEGFL